MNPVASPPFTTTVAEFAVGVSVDKATHQAGETAILFHFHPLANIGWAGRVGEFLSPDFPAQHPQSAVVGHHRPELSFGQHVLALVARVATDRDVGSLVASASGLRNAMVAGGPIACCVDDVARHLLSAVFAEHFG